MVILRSVLLFAVLLAWVPGALWAHAELEASSPTAGQRLNSPPTRLDLRFTERVEAGFARIVLRGPAGEIELGEIAASSESELTVRVLGAMGAGEYVVEWRVAGADGHPISDSYTFVLAGVTGPASSAETSAAEEPQTAEPSSSAASDGQPSSVAERAEFDAESPSYVAIRWFNFAGILGTLGLSVFMLLVLPAAAGGEGDRRFAEGAVRLARRYLAGTVLLLSLALAVRLWAQLRALSPPEGGLDASILAPLLRTTWGVGWQVQWAAIIALIAGAWFAKRKPRAGWLVVGAAAVLVAFTPALSGHAVSSDEFRSLRVVADGLHVIGAGGWLGTLAALIGVGVPLALRGAEEVRGKYVAKLVEAFSPLALVFAGLVVLTGALAAWLEIGSIAALTGSRYGQVLLLKLGILGIVFLTGAYNWRVVKPSLGAAAAASPLRRSASVELAAGAAVLLVTAVLVATPQPAPPDQSQAPIETEQLTHQGNDG